MAYFRKIHTNTLGDARFRELSVDGKLAFFLTLVHPSLTALGTWMIARDGLVGHLVTMGMTSPKSEKAVDEIEAAGFIVADWGVGLLIFPNYLKHNQPTNPLGVRGLARALDQIPECALRDTFFATVKVLSSNWGESFVAELPLLIQESTGTPFPARPESAGGDLDVRVKRPEKEVPRGLDGGALEDDRRRSELMKALWNEHRGSMVHSVLLTAKLYKKATARLHSPDLNKLGLSDPENYVPIFRFMADDPFWNGTKAGGNGTKFKARLVWLLESDERVIGMFERFSDDASRSPARGGGDPF